MNVLRRWPTHRSSKGLSGVTPMRIPTAAADSAHTNRSRFLEQLILLAEPIFSWEMPPPRPWWKFWGNVPQPPELVAPAHDRQIIG